jgi:predicted metalloenzyme YecM
MNADTPLEQQFTEAFDTLARAGSAAYRVKYGVLPVLSHICFKFSSPHTYENYASEAVRLGKVTRTNHNGHEITWCKLHKPLSAGVLVLHWIELVHPAKDAHHATGVSSIGYSVKGLEEVIRLPSANPDIVFRYQGIGAEEMVA